MFTTSVKSDGCIDVAYDGFTFCIIPFAPDCIGVTCMRCDVWDYYEPKPYRSMAEACEAIFGGTILVNRTECGHIYYDNLGNIAEIIPLSYYELPADEQPAMVAYHFLDQNTGELLGMAEIERGSSFALIWDVEGDFNRHSYIGDLKGNLKRDVLYRVLIEEFADEYNCDLADVYLTDDEESQILMAF